MVLATPMSAIGVTGVNSGALLGPVASAGSGVSLATLAVLISVSTWPVGTVPVIVTTATSSPTGRSPTAHSTSVVQGPLAASVTQLAVSPSTRPGTSASVMVTLRATDGPELDTVSV